MPAATLVGAGTPGAVKRARDELGVNEVGNATVVVPIAEVKFVVIVVTESVVVSGGKGATQ